MNKTAIISLFLSSTLACSSSDECPIKYSEFYVSGYRYPILMKCATISTDFTQG